MFLAGLSGSSEYIFVVVQSLSRVQLFLTPCTVARQASLSFTISWSLLKFMSIESVMPSTSSYATPFSSCPQSFLAVSEGLVGRQRTWTGQFKTRESFFQECRTQELQKGPVSPRHIFLRFAQFASRVSGAAVCVHLLLPRDSPDTGPVACTFSVLHGQLMSSPAPLLYLGSCPDMSNKLSGEGRWSTLCQEEASLVQAPSDCSRVIMNFLCGWWKGDPQNSTGDAHRKAPLRQESKASYQFWRKGTFF